MSATCEAIIGYFVYGPDRCGEPAAGLVNTDEGTFSACAEHLGAA